MELLVKQKQKRKITAADVDAIAKLIVTRRLTETEACLLLEIKPDTWFTWKGVQKNASKNVEALARVRAAWIESKCASIDEMGQPEAGKKRDWRAHAWLLERFHPDRFAAQPPQQQQQGGLSPTVINVWLESARDRLASGSQDATKAGLVVDVEPAAAVEDRPDKLLSCGVDTTTYSGVAMPGEHNTPQDSAKH